MVLYPTRAQIPGEANVQFSYHTDLKAKLHPGAECVGTEAGLPCSHYGTTRRNIGGDIGDPVLMQRSWMSSGHAPPKIKQNQNQQHQQQQPKNEQRHPTRPQRSALPSRSQQTLVNVNEQDRSAFLSRNQMPVGYTGIDSRSSRMEAAQHTRQRYQRVAHTGISSGSYGSYGQY